MEKGPLATLTLLMLKSTAEDGPWPRPTVWHACERHSSIVPRREAPVNELCREAGISRSRFYELRARYRACGEPGLRPKPRPRSRPGRQLPEPPVDAIVACAVEHPTHGQRAIALVLATPRFGAWG